MMQVESVVVPIVSLLLVQLPTGVVLQLTRIVCLPSCVIPLILCVRRLSAVLGAVSLQRVVKTPTLSCGMGISLQVHHVLLSVHRDHSCFFSVQVHRTIQVRITHVLLSVHRVHSCFFVQVHRSIQVRIIHHVLPRRIVITRFFVQVFRRMAANGHTRITGAM